MLHGDGPKVERERGQPLSDQERNRLVTKQGVLKKAIGKAQKGWRFADMKAGVEALTTLLTSNRSRTLTFLRRTSDFLNDSVQFVNRSSIY